MPPASSTDPLSRRSLLGAAVVLGALAAGCRRQGLGGSPEDIVHRAPGATIAAGPWRVNLQRTSLQASGVVDWKADRLMLATAEGSASGKRVSEVIMIGNDVWVRPQGGAWAPVPLDPDQQLSLPAGLRSSDILATLELAAGAEEAKVFGGQQVQAASTIRYTAKCDPVVAAGAAAAPTRRGRLMDLPRTINHLTRLDVYIDDRNRIRRMDLEDDLVSPTPTTRPDGARFVTTMELLEPGVSADIRPPV